VSLTAPRTPRGNSILFVCSGNTCRSPMAEAIARKSAGGQLIHLQSAGLKANTDDPAAADAVETMRKRGIDLRAHRSRHVSKVDLSRFDAVVAMSPQVAKELQELLPPGERRIVTWDVPDPFGKGAAAYEATAAKLEGLVAALLRTD